MDFKDLLPLFVTGVIGYIGGILTHVLKNNSTKVSAKRERMIKNVSKAEDYIQLMIEESFLDQDLMRLEDLNEIVETNIEIITKGFRDTEEEIKKAEEELRQGKNKELPDDVKCKKKKLLSTIGKYVSLLDDTERKNDKIKKELEEVRTKSNQAKERLIVDDIGSTFLTIDPSGKISGYLHELQKIQSDNTIDFYSNARAIELRSLINKFFTEKISKGR